MTVIQNNLSTLLNLSPEVLNFAEACDISDELIIPIIKTEANKGQYNSLIWNAADESDLPSIDPNNSNVNLLAKVDEQGELHFSLLIYLQEMIYSEYEEEDIEPDFAYIESQIRLSDDEFIEVIPFLSSLDFFKYISMPQCK